MDICPACEKEIDLFRSFWRGDNDYAAQYVYECEHCGAKLDIEVIPEPAFGITLQERRVMKLSQRMHNVIWGPWIDDPIAKENEMHEWLKGVCQLEARNEKLFEFISDGHELDESRTWFWDDDIVAVLRDDNDRMADRRRDDTKARGGE